MVYNVAAEQLRTVLSEIAARHDPEFRWAGDSLVIERLGVQFHLDPFAAHSHAGVKRQPAVEVGWAAQRELAAGLKQIARVEHQHGYVLVAVGLAMTCMPLYELAKLGGAVIAQRVADLSARLFCPGHKCRAAGVLSRIATDCSGKF